jgi:hypothetical protein
MKRTVACIDRPIVSDEKGIDPIVVHVAIEKFGPPPIARETKLVAEERRIVQAGNNHHVKTLSIDPSVKRDYPVNIIRIKRIDRLAESKNC